MDLSTSYLGFKLTNPLVASASPLSQHLENIQRMEEAGISAVVLHSLFEEQIIKDNLELARHMEQGTESFAEALTYFPQPKEFVVGPDEYLEHIRRAKEMVKIPIIASLNGYTLGGWTKYAKLIQDAGADAIELNIYFVPTDFELSGTDVEDKYAEILKQVKSSVNIPVAVKLAPFFSSMSHFAARLDKAGADGLVLFNRFYQPDIDLENLEIVPGVILSTPMALRLPLRWIAILFGKIGANLAASSGIHQATDVLKVMMAGADVAMVCSALYKHKIPHTRTVLRELKLWMEEHEYDSISQMRGSMSQKSCENPEAFERASYVRAIKSDVGLRV